MHQTLLRITDLAKSYGWRDIISHISFELSCGEKTAIVGPNGIGKSTLLQIIAGLTPAGAGSCQLLRIDAIIGYLPQEPELPSAGTPLTLLAGAHAALGAAARCTSAEALKRFGFSGSEANLTVTALSGGQKTRLALARIWLSLPDLLLLDEPTNHLDQDGIAWLEAAVREYPHTVLCVSHDRYFLDQVATRILELSATGITNYNGNYTAYRSAKEAAFRSRMRQYTDEQKELQRIETAIDRQLRWFQYAHDHAGTQTEIRSAQVFYRARAKKMASRAKSTIKRLERIKKEAIAKPRPEAAIHLNLQTDDRAGTRLYLAENVGKAYERVLFRDSNFSIMRGDKVGLIGPNGSGKTTLLNMLLGITEPTWGSIWRSPAGHAGYLAQEIDNLNMEQSLLESILAMLPEQSSLARRHARALLASFLFRPEDISKPLQVLSYGEHKRIALIRLLIGGHNILLLDEPTNHLDLPAREKLEEALLSYNGTLVLVSHDRYLLRKICRKVLAITAGSVTQYPGTYDEYMQARARALAGGSSGGAAVTAPAAEVATAAQSTSGTPAKLAATHLTANDRLVLEHRLALVAARLSECKDQQQLAALEEEYLSLSRALRPRFHAGAHRS